MLLWFLWAHLSLRHHALDMQCHIINQTLEMLVFYLIPKFRGASSAIRWYQNTHHTRTHFENLRQISSSLLVTKIAWFCSIKEKRSTCISDFMQTTFFYHDKFLNKLADNQCSYITNNNIGSICQICTYNILP